jgi:hypothetical protein
MSNLISEIELRRTNFKSDSYAMSIGELVNLYESEEIVIRPEYQRLFRWSHGQKVKLIESIILGIPIPSIFVYQDENGIWELVDGLQRVSTILQLFGILKDSEPLTLDSTKHIPSLEGYKWTNDNPDKELPQGIKLSIKRAKINLTIILSESDKRAKFEVFQRLNTGGSNASNQEVRNNIMIMIDPEKFNWFNDLSNSPDFLETLSLSDRLYNEEYHKELLLRHIALSNYKYTRKDVGDYLDAVNDDILNGDTFDFKSVEDNFNKTYSVLNKILGEKCFKKYNGDDFKGKFLESSFEAISVGLSKNIEGYTLPQDEQIIKTKIEQLYQEDIYNQTSGSGSNAKTRIPKLVPFAIEYFKK